MIQGSGSALCTTKSWGHTMLVEFSIIIKVFRESSCIYRNDRDLLQMDEVVLSLKFVMFTMQMIQDHG